MTRLILAIIFTSFIIHSCDMSSRSMTLDHESLFLNQFRYHSLMKRGAIIELQIYKDDLLNDYFFTLQNDEFKLTRNSLQFDINKLSKYKKINTVNKKEYSKQIETIAWQLFSKMKEAKVNSFTSEFRKFGVDLMIDFSNKKLLYVSDTLKITNPEWVKLLRQSKQIKDHWYLYSIPK